VVFRVFFTGFIGEGKFFADPVAEAEYSVAGRSNCAALRKDALGGRLQLEQNEGGIMHKRAIDATKLVTTRPQQNYESI